MISKQTSPLSYAARPHVVLKLFGQLSVVLALLTLPPIVVACGCGESRAALAYGAIAILFGVIGGALSRLPRPASLQANEAFVVAALAFLLISVAMTFPFMAAGLPPLDAFFEATSACTTTGLSTSIQVENKPASFLFTRAWMQWYGGLGIVVFSIALIVRPGVLARSLAMSDGQEDELLSSTKAHARRVLVVYLVLTLLAVVTLWMVGGDLFQATLYALAAVSTGGFAPQDASLAGVSTTGFAPLAILFGLAGALPLYLYFRAYACSWRELRRDAQLPALACACLLMAGLLTLLLDAGGTFSRRQAWYHGPLLALSAQTTTGFSTTSISDLDAASKFVLMVAMSTGGSVGSTAGGIKVLRLMILLNVVRQMVTRTCLPMHAVSDPQLGGRKLNELEIRDAFVVASLFVAAISLSWFAFLVFGEAPLDSLFEVVSATGTVGLSTGLCRPELPALLKIVLCADMLMGRLEMFAWLVVLHRGTWFGRRTD